MDQQEFEKYLGEMCLFQGKMNLMANSIELMLDDIFEKIGIGTPQMLGGKINMFKKSKSTLVGNYIGDFEGLIDRLEKFNEYWVIAKHGMIVGGKEDLTIHKDGNFYIFDRGKQDEIGQEFTQIMGALIEISKQI